MSVRFKFRSSVVYDSIDLGGLSSISVREPRDKIVAYKKLKFCKDFELLIFDADTSKALDNDRIQVMERSTVMIKRVPRDLNVGSVARNDVNNVERVTPLLPPLQNVGEDNLDVFRMELFPCTGNLKFTANQKDNVVPRCKLQHLNDIMSRHGASEDELEVWTMVDCDAGKRRRIDRLVRLEARGCVGDLYTHQVVFMTSIWEALWFDLKNRKITRMPVDHQFAGGFKLKSDLIPICHACTMKCQEPMIHKDGKLKRKTLDGEQDFDKRPEDYYYKGSRMTSHEGRHQLDKVTAGRFSGDDSLRIHKKHPDNKHYSSSHRKPAIQSK